MRRNPRFGQAKERYKQKGKKTEASALFQETGKGIWLEYSLHGYMKQWNKKERPLRVGAALLKQFLYKKYSPSNLREEKIKHQKFPIFIAFRTI